MNTLTPIPESCAAVQTALQAYLDGEGIDLVSGASAHCAACPECRGDVRAAIELRRVLQRSHSSAVPPGLVERIVAAALADPVTPAKPATGIRRAGFWVAVAASLLIAGGFLTARWWPAPAVTPQQPQPEVAITPADEPLALRERLVDVGNAVVAFTRRTADQAIEPTWQLLPEKLDAPSLDVVGQFPRAMDPAARSLQQVRQGAAAGLEPMTHSARRALSMLLDMPPLDHDRKPDF